MIHRLVLTGGPCAGKSTGLASIEQKLKSLGYSVIIMSEMATNVITSGLNPVILGSVDFQRLLLEMQISRDKYYNKNLDKLGDKVVILYDRGLLDGEAYCDEEEFRKLLLELGYTRQDILSLYDGVFHLVTAADGAEEFYTLANNTARSESVDEAKIKDKLTLEAWLGHPHLRVINNKNVNFEQKINKLIGEIMNTIGEPIPLEIERKFLVKTPDLNKLFNRFKFNRSEIIQTYLYSRDGVERRIRQRGSNGEYSYYYTEKSFVEHGTRKEIERIISEHEYLTLLMEADTAKNQIRKTRYCFVYKDRYFELDIYPFWDDKAILEVEVSDINENIDIPDIIEVIDDVTGNSRYSNYELASRGL